MIEQSEISKIKKAAEEFFEKMTIEISGAEVGSGDVKKDDQNLVDQGIESREVVNIDIKLNEPQILIGQGGQTLFEVQRLLGMVINKKIQSESSQKIFYLNLDINDYKKQKVDYLKRLAKEVADQVSLTKEERALIPMSSYERRIIHAELAERADVTTESQGDGLDRHIVIKAN